MTGVALAAVWHASKTKLELDGCYSQLVNYNLRQCLNGTTYQLPNLISLSFTAQIN